MTHPRYAALAPLTLLCSLLLGLLPCAIASAHFQEVEGVVLSVLPASREVVVRSDAAGSQPGVTTLFRLAADVRPASLHAGDRILGDVEELHGRLLLDDVRVLPADAPASIIRTVDPLLAGDTLPATAFIDQRGRPFNFADFRGKDVVLAFIYTRCPDAKECPLITAHFRVLQARLGNGPYHLVEMTLDPNHDTPHVLARYGALFGADPNRWTFGTGNPTTVLDFERRFGIDPFVDPHVGLIHTERTVFVDRSGKIVDFMDQAGWNPADVIARLQAIDSGPSNPLARLDFELSKVAVAVCGNGVAGFSGLQDLVIVLVIVGAGGFALVRLGRKIFADQM